jgi:hypothetical protein
VKGVFRIAAKTVIFMVGECFISGFVTVFLNGLQGKESVIKTF